MKTCSLTSFLQLFRTQIRKVRLYLYTRVEYLYFHRLSNHRQRNSATCCQAYARINTKIENSATSKILTTKNFSSKLYTCDYVGNNNQRANFSANRFNGGFSPSRWNITALWLLKLSCPFFSGKRPGRTSFTDFHALWLKRRVWAQEGSFSGSRR